MHKLVKLTSIRSKGTSFVFVKTGDENIEKLKISEKKEKSQDITTIDYCAWRELFEIFIGKDLCRTKIQI